MAEHTVHQVDVRELESECPHGVNDQVRGELRSERSDDGRRLREVTERAVPGQAGESLDGVQAGEDHLGPDAGVLTQAMQATTSLCSRARPLRKSCRTRRAG